MSPDRDPFEEAPWKSRVFAAKRAPRILIVQTGSAGSLVEAHGDYPDWFRRGLALDEADTPVLRAHMGERLSPESLAAHGADGILVTGSPLSVTSREPWMAELGGELLRAGERGLPVLGVCFGHQLLCESAGAQVLKNPRGPELGTIAVQLTEAGAKDPLFAWTRDASEPSGWAPDCAGGRVLVQSTHADAVYPVPEGARLLASNEQTPVQAVRFSETVASVQFHPELRGETLREIIASREADAIGLHANELRAVRETRSGLLLRAFVEQVRRA